MKEIKTTKPIAPVKAIADKVNVIVEFNGNVAFGGGSLLECELYYINNIAPNYQLTFFSMVAS